MVKSLLRYLIAVSAICIGLATTGFAAEIDKQELEAWADDYFAQALEQTAVPGAVLSVVQGNRIVLIKGYGVERAGTADAVDPTDTLFRIGSISKVFTAIAALQMADEGKLDLNRDVNDYLQGLRVPDTFPEKVTPGHLLSHTAGFATDTRGVLITEEANTRLSDRERQRQLAPRTRSPGLYLTYDNNGFGLLGLVLESIDRQAFSETIQTRIFQPLAMTHSVVGLPVPRRADAAGAHLVLADGQAAAIETKLLSDLEKGAGDLTSTGADMARFMMALLGQGRLGNKRILSPKAFAELTDFESHRLHPGIPGMGRAIYERSAAGHRTIGHDGGVKGFAATMMLYPQEQLGFFLAVNARTPNPLAEESWSGFASFVRQSRGTPPAKIPVEANFSQVHDLFAERFLGRNTIATDLSATEAGDAQPPIDIDLLSGTYRNNTEGAVGLAGRVAMLFLDGPTVSVEADNTLLIAGRGPYKQIAPNLFENSSSGDRIAFKTVGNDVLMGRDALSTFKKRSWYGGPIFTVYPLPVFILIILVVTVLAFRFTPQPRRLAHTSLAIAAIILVCLYLEGEFANRLIVADKSVLVTLWRLIFHAALFALIALPIWLLARTSNTGATRLNGTATLSAVAITFCGLGLLWLTWHWGVVGRTLF